MTEQQLDPRPLRLLSGLPVSPEGNTNCSRALATALAKSPRARIIQWATPIERQDALSKQLGVELFLKRDDLNGVAFGGNKLRQLEFYFGPALEAGADLVLITGAVQSNYVRLTAALAARLGLACHAQLEDRVNPVDAIYRRSGNVLLDDLFGATRNDFPTCEDEQAADANLQKLARKFEQEGYHPYIIPLALGNPPRGALGYVDCAIELIDQGAGFDVLVVPSGTGFTHAGLLFGLRTLGWRGPVLGICVRRPAAVQWERIWHLCQLIAELLDLPNPVSEADVRLYDDVLAPGYGTVNDSVAGAMTRCARLEGLLLDPVYTARMMAGLFKRVGDGTISPGSKVLTIHTGGLPAIFGYERDLRKKAIAPEEQRRLPPRAVDQSPV